MGISREGCGLRDGTPPNKKKNTNKQEKKHQQTRKKHQQTRKKHQQTRKKHQQTRKKHLQTRKTPFKQGKRLSINKKNTFQARKRLSSKGYLPIKCKSLQVAGVPRQGKAVVSDGGYGVIGGGYCLLVWGDAEETKGKRGRRWRGVGPAGRPSLFPSGVSVILKIG